MRRKEEGKGDEGRKEEDGDTEKERMRERGQRTVNVVSGRDDIHAPRTLISTPEI